MATRIFNPTSGTVTLPPPYGQMLPSGTGVVTADSQSQVISNLGGLENFVRSGLTLDAAPSGSALTPPVGTVGKCGHVMYPAAPANEANAAGSTLVSDVALADGALTIAAQPKYPCKLNVYKTDANASAAAILDLVGVGPAGEAVAESVTMTAADGTKTYVTNNAFAKITTATVRGTSGAAGIDHIAIGQKSALGLPIPQGALNVVVFKEGVAATAAAASADEAVGTVDAVARTVIPTTAPDGTKAFHFWYSYTY